MARLGTLSAAGIFEITDAIGYVQIEGEHSFEFSSNGVLLDGTDKPRLGLLRRRCFQQGIDNLWGTR